MFDSHQTFRHLSVYIAIFGLVLTVSHADADERQQSWCAGVLARAKRQNTQVYSRPDTRSRVVKAVSPTDFLCSVGAREEFMVIQLEGEENLDPPDGAPSPSSLAYVREVDVMEFRPPQASGRGLLDRIRGFFEQLQGGVVPEDPLGTYRIPESGDGM